MNILFRKNFQDRGGDRYGKGRARGGAGGRRTGDYGYGTMDASHAFRTHIFLSPSNIPQEFEEDAPALSKRPSVTLMRWATGGGGGGGGAKRKPSGGKSDYPLNQNCQQDTPSRQVSFNNGGSRPGTYSPGGGGTGAGPIVLQSVPRAEPVTLSTIDRDCFIIPVASIDRFLPAGVPLPLPSAKPSQLSVLEVDDPKLTVLVHLMTAMEPIEPILESPLAVPLAKQRVAAVDLLSEVSSAKTAMEGMLLSNIERNSEFPFIAYYLINKNQTDPREFFYKCRASALKKFDPQCTRYTAAHTFDLFNEVATIARPPVETATKRPNSEATGYIISVYKVFEGDDGERFEKNWLYWTGARMIYRYLPKSVGLRRITLHKSQSNGDKLYLLIVECSNFLQDLTAAAVLIPALRARLCGYTGLYRTTAIF